VNSIAVKTPLRKGAPPPSAVASRVFALLALTAIIILAIAVRAHHLGEQSVWYDEYITISHVDAPSLTSCLEQQRAWDWHMVPAYHIVQYYWWRLVKGSIVGVRWLSILLGVLAIPVLYRFGCDLYGRTAGLVAALCLALSPFHIFHAQAIRCYALVTLAGIVSAYAFFRLVRDGGRTWWIVNIAANTLLMWTHIMGVLLLAPEGLFLVLFRFRQWRRAALWIAIHAVLLAPLVFWVLSIDAGSGPEPPMPTYRQVFDYLCRRDTFYLRGVEGVLPLNEDELVLADRARWLLPKRQRFERALLYALGLSSVLLVLWTWRDARDKGTGKPPPDRDRGKQPAACLTPWGPWESLGFLILWFVLPALILLALSWVLKLWLFIERFSIYSMPALYLLVGGGIAGFRRAPIRIALSAALVLLYGFQTSVALSVPTRHGYLPAAHLIQSQAARDDVIVVHGWQSQKLFAFNLGPTDMRVLNPEGFEGLVASTDGELAQGYTVWAVFVSAPEMFNIGPEALRIAEKYERYLLLQGVAYSRTIFPGMQSVYVYRSAPPRDYAAPDSATRDALVKTITENLDAAMQCLHEGMTLQGSQDADGAVAAFRKALERDPYNTMAYDALAPILLYQRKDLTALIEISQEFIGATPRHAKAYVYLGSACQEQGMEDQAIAAFGKAVELAPEKQAWVYGNLAMLYLKHEEYDNVIAAARKGIELRPDDAQLHVNLGRALSALGRYDQAVVAFRRAVRAGAKSGNDYWNLALALIGNADLEEAVAPAHKAFDAEAGLKANYEKLLAAICVDKDPAAVRAEAERLRDAGTPVPKELLGRIE